MKTVSLELSKNLKEAGLKWYPNNFHWVTEKDKRVILTPFDFELSTPEEMVKKYTWLPTLSDILAELEGMGYGWAVFTVKERYATELRGKENTPHKIPDKIQYMAIGETPEEAAGKALLWALQNEPQT